MTFLPRQSDAIAPSAWGQAMRDTELAQPKTSTVVEAFAQEATIGVGTGYADVQAIRAKTAGGKQLAKEDMTAYEGVPWYEGITDEAAQVQKEFNDASQARAKIISDSSTSQAIVGFAAGFGAGVFEPKNAAIGLGVSVAAPFIGTAGYLGNRARMAYQLAKTSTRARVAIGAGEGVVAAALTEPSNRYSAKVLQQDYTMVDSAFNMLTSTAFGAAVPAVSGLIKAKVEKFKGRTMDVVAAEVDLATQQLELGQRVDVSAVEAAQMGKLADAPVAKQVEAARTFTRYTETPEFKTRFEGSKVVDADGKPMMVYHGTSKDFGQYASGVGDAIFFSDSPETANSYATLSEYASTPNIRPAYLQMKNALEIDAKGADWHSIDFMDNVVDADSIAAYAKKNGYDGLIIKDVVDDMNAEARYGNTTYAVFNPEQAIAAFGADDLDAITARLDAANSETVSQHNTQAIDPRNDTVIDYDAIDALDERRVIMEAEANAEAELYYQQAEADIRQMLDEGTMNEDDLTEYRSILEDLKESKKTTDALETLKLCLTGL